MIKKELMFYSLLDFYPKKEKIKKCFDTLDIEEIIIYKMYVYSIPFEEEYIKDLMWEYLNGWREASLDLAIYHRKRREKNKKRQEYYERERIENGSKDTNKVA